MCLCVVQSSIFATRSRFDVYKIHFHICNACVFLFSPVCVSMHRKVHDQRII